MRYGVVLPFGDGVDIHNIGELAHEAEEAGWDGVFVWDGIFGVDPWVALAAIAMRTERVRLGPLVTPVSRRRPWKLFTETVTLDQLSNGRLILSVGLGALDTGFAKVGEETDRKIRAELLDEGLEILTGLWSGQPFSYNGKHYQVKDVTLQHPRNLPVQSPRIPIWVVAAWPRKKSMRRVLRYDGVLPIGKKYDGTYFHMIPTDISDMRTFIAEQRSQTTPFDIVMEAEYRYYDREQMVEIVCSYTEVGVTWWVENADLWKQHGGLEGMRARIKQGPPRPQ